MDRNIAMLLESEKDIAETARLSLESRGFETVISKDIKGGIELFNKFRPNLILIDMDMSGSANFIKKLKKLRNENIEIILFLSKNVPYSPDLGALRYLRKPFETEDLICSIKEAEKKLELRDERNRFLIKLMEYSEGLEKLVKEKTAELMAANERLRTLSVTDDLTGAYNRKYFFERFEADINQASRYGYPLSVMIVDIDDFKLVNDRKGHAAGDSVLRGLAGLLMRNLRKGETVTRYGGEEFAVILPHINEADALKAAEILRKKVESADFSASGENINITVSLGVAELNKDIKSPIIRADLALNEAKKSGKNRVQAWKARKGK